MIFRSELVRAIARGAKTQTRRPVKGDQPCRYKVGKSVAVQPGRGRPAALRIVITAVRQEPVGEITFEDARAEGFRTPTEFRLAWVAIHDSAWLARPVKEPCDCWTHHDGEHFRLRERTEREILARFEARHASRPVWVISFEQDHSEPARFLSAGWPDYTSSPAMAARDEQQAVSPSVQEWITDRAGMTTEQWRVVEARNHDLERALLSQEDRIKAAQRKAQRAGIDISRELWMVRNMQAKGKDPRAVNARVEVLERKAFTSRMREAA